MHSVLKMTLMKLLTRKLSLTPNQWNQSPKTAVLLLNMGGPNNAEEVRPYLQELFLDEEILKLPVQPLLGRFIAWRRTPAIIKRYEDHLGHYSPTDKWFKLQGAALENKMDKISPLTAPHKCYSAFRYAEPRTPTVINELKAEMESIDKIVLFSQYPQHSCSTSGSSLCDAYRSMKKSLGKEESSKVSVIDNWYSFPGYAELWTGMIESKLASLKEEHGYGNEDIHVVYSAHSLPEAYIYEKGDQYANEIQATVDLVHKNLGEFKHTLGWQSKVGPKQRKWLSPSTPEILDANTHKCVLVVPIAFTTDHIETLDEIDLEFKEDHADKNEHIEVFDRVDCFNDMPEFTDLTARILKNHIDDNFTTKIRGQCQNCDGKDCRNMRKYFHEVNAAKV